MRRRWPAPRRRDRLLQALQVMRLGLGERASSSRAPAEPPFLAAQGRLAAGQLGGQADDLRGQTGHPTTSMATKTTPTVVRTETGFGKRQRCYRMTTGARTRSTRTRQRHRNEDDLGDAEDRRHQGEGRRAGHPGEPTSSGRWSAPGLRCAEAQVEGTHAVAKTDRDVTRSPGSLGHSRTRYSVLRPSQPPRGRGRKQHVQRCAVAGARPYTPTWVVWPRDASRWRCWGSCDRCDETRAPTRRRNPPRVEYFQSHACCALRSPCSAALADRRSRAAAVGSGAKNSRDDAPHAAKKHSARSGWARPSDHAQRHPGRSTTRSHTPPPALRLPQARALLAGAGHAIGHAANRPALMFPPTLG